MIKEILDSKEKREISRDILEQLPEWFGIPESTENYIQECSNQYFFELTLSAPSLQGFISFKETSKDTIELAVMGVKKEYHRKGIGKNLFLYAKKLLLEKGYSFIQVKTVQIGKYSSYDIANKFYISLVFKEFELFPTLWNENNPCQIYIISL
ncbi:MAG: GNAT family N-acetyltransferase [Lachnospirales bacterium]